MSDNRARNGTLGAILGALIAVAFAIFLLNGGDSAVAGCPTGQSAVASPEQIETRG